MKNISFMLTTAQIRARTKHVTRRMGWLKLKEGEFLQGVVKGQGLKPGEKIDHCISSYRSQAREMESRAYLYLQAYHRRFRGQPATP